MSCCSADDAAPASPGTSTPGGQAACVAHEPALGAGHGNAEPQVASAEASNGRAERQQQGSCAVPSALPERGQSQPPRPAATCARQAHAAAAHTAPAKAPLPCGPGSSNAAVLAEADDPAQNAAAFDYAWESDDSASEPELFYDAVSLDGDMLEQESAQALAEAEHLAADSLAQSIAAFAHSGMSEQGAAAAAAGMATEPLNALAGATASFADAQQAAQQAEWRTVPQAPSAAPRKGTVAWYFMHRQEPIHAGSQLSILQSAHSIAELKRRGASNEVCDLVCAYACAKLVPGSLHVPSMHIARGVLGVEDAAQFEFAWCPKCGKRHEPCAEEPSLSDSCSRCATPIYKVRSTPSPMQRAE